MSSRPAADALLVHLAAGIGNVVLATPLLVQLACAGRVDCLASLTPSRVAEALRATGFGR